MKHTPVTSLVLAGLLFAVPAAAQTWQAIGAPNNSGAGAYWNNVSDDNVGAAVCNAGGILTNTPALTAASCTNQGPVFLPLSPAPLTTANVFLGGIGGTNPGAFRFSAGAYYITRIGRVAGDLGTSWGVITDAGVVYTAAQLAAGPTVLNGPFAVWITQSLPLSGAGTIYTSTQSTGAVAIGARGATINQQFAVFTNSYGAGSAGLFTDAFGAIIDLRGAAMYVGMEDNVNGGRGFGAAVPGRVSDRDYNDIIIRVGNVPEPGTVGMFGAGLVALVVAARRRRLTMA